MARHVSAAAQTPRVRAFVVCDEAVASETEADVHTLENVRTRVVVDSCPCMRPLNVYLQLSCYRAGRYRGMIRIRDEGDDIIHQAAFLAHFTSGTPFECLYVELGDCEFPAAGVVQYPARVP